MNNFGTIQEIKLSKRRQKQMANKARNSNNIIEKNKKRRMKYREGNNKDSKSSKDEQN